MIARYSRPIMIKLWEDQHRFQTWLDVELTVLDILKKHQLVPQEAVEQLRKTAKIQLKRILKLEKNLKHDVLAFTTSISEQVGEVGRYFHYGLTSSDVVDTAFALILLKALQIIHKDLAALHSLLIQLAKRYRKLVCIGRTHGMHAEPTIFGLKFLSWACEFQRHQDRLQSCINRLGYGKLSGAVGCYGALSPQIEYEVLKKLNLKPELVATQVIPRDRHAEVFCVLANIGASIEKVALELRHLQRTEVGEVEEGFGVLQKGSSAMPHKKNPIASENLTGCARLLRGYVIAALENVALWHERDMSHSSVERVIAPDSTILVDYMLNRLKDILESLHVHQSKVRRNLDLTHGVYFSGHVLLALVKKGVSREQAYRVVQRSAHKALVQQRPFLKELLQEKLIQKKLSHKELKEIFKVQRYLKNVDKIYRRVLNHEEISSKRTSSNRIY